MLTVEKVHRLTGVSVRTLHHYDKIGLLKPCTVTAAGYRLYDSDSLEKLGQIMLFKELGFSLNDIKEILQNPNFDKNAALDRQIKILEIKKERIERIISFAEQIKKTGEFKMDFSVFDTKKAEEYQQLAKKEWGGTAEYKEYEQKTAGYSKEHHAALSGKLMDIFKVFGTLKNLSPGDTAVQEQVKTLQDFIT
ncbi:MAG: MerR family transcriptional regulator, partial [Oscillospiraceae bacterium]|nr:MerR family transcriptional regulator [Candidatus Equicaccousia limihippi]